MEYTINNDGQKIATQLDISESYDVFWQSGTADAITIGTAYSEAEAEAMARASEYPYKEIWIWDNRTNN